MTVGQMSFTVLTIY